MPDPLPINSADIQAITPAQAHALRQQVLRPHQPITAMAYPGDDHAETFHLGAFIQGRLIGIASVYREPMPNHLSTTDARLRGMAIAPEFQGQGIGTALLNAARLAARNAGTTRLWCNARATAMGFYKHQGFAADGEPFDLPGIGEHYIMSTTLKVSHPPIMILGYSEASMLLRDPDQRTRIAACISISGQRDPHLEIDGLNQLNLRFDDSPSPKSNDELEAYRIRELRRKAAKIGLDINPPNSQDAQAIIKFADELQDECRVVLFQCFAGISRSSGAALLSMARWLGPGLEQESVQKILEVRPAAQPHDGLVHFGDQLLGREGKLLSALEQSQRQRL